MKHDPESLAALSSDQRRELHAAAAARCETRLNRATAEHRDLTGREHTLTVADRSELEALAAADALVETRAEQREWTRSIANEIDRMPRPETRARLGEFAMALQQGVPCRIRVETRSVTTTNAGARHAVAGAELGRPRWLYVSFARVMGPPFSHGVGTTCLAQWG